MSFYCDINKKISEHEVSKTFEYANKYHLPLIAGGDTNAHSYLFGNERNRRGDELEDIILEHSLKIENIGTEPTFDTIRGTRQLQSCIDITLSRGIKGQISNWEVKKDYNASDHNTM